MSPVRSKRSGGSAVAAAPPKPVPVAPVVRQASAPRQWSPKALIGAVLLVLLGGLVVMVALPAYANRVDVVVLARPVSAGHVLVADDLRTAKVAAGPDVSVVRAVSQGMVLGKMARSDLSAGVLLSPSLVADGNGLVAGQALVGLALKTGQLPATGASAGQKVSIVGTPGTVTGPTSPLAGAAFSGVVVSTGVKDPATGVTVLDVRVRQADAASVARLASTGNLAVLVLPSGG